MAQEASKMQVFNDKESGLGGNSIYSIFSTSGKQNSHMAYKKPTYVKLRNPNTHAPEIVVSENY